VDRDRCRIDATPDSAAQAKLRMFASCNNCGVIPEAKPGYWQETILDDTLTLPGEPVQHRHPTAAGFDLVSERGRRDVALNDFAMQRDQRVMGRSEI
jgi:hypothetical protein